MKICWIGVKQQSLTHSMPRFWKKVVSGAPGGLYYYPSPGEWSCLHEIKVRWGVQEGLLYPILLMIPVMK